MILLVIGLIVAALFGLLALITMLLMATSNGRIDAEEAGPFIGVGCCCSSVGGLLAAGGVIWMIAGTKK